MRTSTLLLGSAAILLLTAASPAPFEGCRIGTKLGADGHVVEAKTKFAADEPIHMTVGWPNATPRLQFTVDVLDANGQELKSLMKTTKDEKLVTVPLRNLSKGHYTARAIWGKRNICNQDFEIH